MLDVALSKVKRAIFHLLAVLLIVGRLVVTSANLDRVLLGCEDYCDQATINQYNAAASNILFWRALGLATSLLGFALLLALLPSLKLILAPVTLAETAVLASGLLPFRESIILPITNSVLSITETAGLPLAYRTTECINALRSYCPGGGPYTSFSWTNFSLDLMFFLTIGYVVALRFSGFLPSRIEVYSWLDPPGQADPLTHSADETRFSEARTNLLTNKSIPRQVQNGFYGPNQSNDE